MSREKRKDIKTQIWEELEERGWVTPLSEAQSAFCSWWQQHDHCPKRIKGRDGNFGWTSGIDAHKAWQIADYRVEFRERRRENAAGTGINYAYFGWHKNEPKPRTSSPEILERHREWCKQKKRPDPLDVPDKVPEEIAAVRSMPDVKAVLGFTNVSEILANKMDMNKAIGWTKEDSDAANEQLPF